MPTSSATPTLQSCPQAREPTTCCRHALTTPAQSVRCTCHVFLDGVEEGVEEEAQVGHVVLLRLEDLVGHILPVGRRPHCAINNK